MHGDGLQHGGDLHRDTITIVGSALDFQAKTVSSAMTRIDDVFMLPIDSKLDFETMGRILKSGHSRIPIYEMIGERKRVVSVLLTKQLILVDPEGTWILALIRWTRLTRSRRDPSAVNPHEFAPARARRSTAAGPPQHVPGGQESHGDRGEAT